MRTLTIILFLAGMSFVALAQNSMREESIKEIIRERELRETRAVVNKNLEELKTIWAEELMVNNPFNQVLHSRQEVIDRMESGFINYSSFERDIESMLVLDDIVIVMGQETIMPLGGSHEAGIQVRRRYTNIWKQLDGQWQIRVRHANVICGNQE